MIRKEYIFKTIFKNFISLTDYKNNKSGTSPIAVIIIFVILFFSSMAFISCDITLDPKTEFKDRFILYLIMRADTNYHIARVFHNYNVNGLDPNTNKVDPAIKDAVIKIWGNNSVNIFKDTLISRDDTSRYNDPVYFYYLDNYKPVQEESLKVTAYLDNGVVLQARSKVPVQINLDSLYLLPVLGRNDFSFSWPVNSEEVCYSYQAKLYYKQRIEGQGEFIKWIEIPLEIHREGDSVKTVYPEISTNHYVRYTNEALDWAMKKISESEPSKSYFTITRIVFEIISFDKPLSDYYSLTHGYSDSFSIRLDENIYTNIEGGLGVFGVCYKQGIMFKLKEDYILSYGYKYER
ncbi:MAG: DUF4249 family protein [Ignavibacteriales bacterium]|nr:MAG: DUF4249 family protein [Ignavibacteriales bacterium]